MTVKKTSISNKEISHKQVPVVAIGASAGGLNAIIQFITPIPPINSLAFVIITHLDREHKSIMPELIQRQTKMPVKSIVDGTKIEPNTVYVAPPNKNILIKNNILLLVEESEPHYSNLPINYFFYSLARANNIQAIAIILSGCGADGSLGLLEIKQHGGIVMVQDPKTAGYDSMPINAINTGLIDYIGSPEKIYQELKKILNVDHPSNIKILTTFRQIFALLQSITGYDFSGYKPGIVQRRIDRQIHRLHMKSITEYINYLHLHPQEVSLLFKDLLIGVTCFFRDPDAFYELQYITLRKLLRNKQSDHTFRAWVPGCSTGEEAYSLAILLREYMHVTKQYFNVQIFATDIDLIALDTARNGVYSEKSIKNIGSERLDSNFTKVKTGYKINKDIREMVVFGAQNIVQDPPFTKLDFISCRNLLIYLNTTIQQKLFTIFHYSLKAQGILFLGASESARQHTDLFKPIGKKGFFFERKQAAVPRHQFPLSQHFNQNIINRSAYQFHNEFMVDNGLEGAVKDFLVSQFVPSCVIVDKQGDIVFSYGDLSSYLTMTSPPIHANIVDISAFHIKASLIPFFTKDTFNSIQTKISKKIVNSLFGPFIINLTIIPVREIKSLSGYVLIQFEKVQKITKNMQNNNLQLLDDVEQELSITKENLQTTIEALEANNEEMQSTNEEFQSINEELESSKEELQSVNEELLIVNNELQNRIEQNTTVYEDMNNLFNNTNIAAIFLDTMLLVKRFTPKTQELINVIPTDIGRSFKHFTTNILDNNLIDHAEEVIKTHIPQSFDVQTTNKQWYLVKILPSKTLTNTMDGIVITFIEITHHKIADEKISILDNKLIDELVIKDSILDMVHDSMLILNNKLVVLKANQSFLNLFSSNIDNIIGLNLYEIDNKAWDIPAFKKLLNKALTHTLNIKPFEIEYKSPSIGHKKLLINIQKVSLKQSDPIILLRIEELITEVLDK
jgi:two-component system CheB/CheR fusion protein